MNEIMNERTCKQTNELKNKRTNEQSISCDLDLHDVAAPERHTLTGPLTRRSLSLSLIAHKVIKLLSGQQLP